MIDYHFTFDDGLELTYRVDTERRYDPRQDAVDAPAWTRLENNRCTNCPLQANA